MRLLGGIGAVALAMLAACGSGDDTGQSLQMLKSAFGQRGETQTNLRASLTPDAVAQVGAPTLIATFPQRRNVQLVLIRTAENSGRVSWLSPSRDLIVLDGGVLVGTRGLGGDLMTADVSDVRVALAGRTDQAERIHRVLDGENALVAEAFICDYTRRPDTATAYFRNVRTTRIDETCNGRDYIFENRYWMSNSGEIVRSLQWVSAAVGYLEYERLSD